MPDLRDFLPQPPWEGPPIPRGAMYPKVKNTLKFPLPHEFGTFFHGTAARNLPGVLAHGLITKPPAEARTYAFNVIDNILAEYSLSRSSVPEDVYKDAYMRLMEFETPVAVFNFPTIHLSADEVVAHGSTMASYEAHVFLHEDIHKFLGRRSKESVFRKRYEIEAGGAVVLTMRIPFGDILDEGQYNYPGQWLQAIISFPENTRQELIEYVFGTAQVRFVLPQSIVEHRFVKPIWLDTVTRPSELIALE